jgi:glucose/arabinose dehydrogenase
MLIASTLLLAALSGTNSPPAALAEPATLPGVLPVAGTAASLAPQVQVEVLATHLEIPWAIDFAPDGRIFLTERPGRIRIIQNGQLQAELWLTLDVATVGEGGLLGLALDPHFADNHFVYVAYTYRTTGGGLGNRLVRLRDEAGKGVQDRVLLDGAAGGIYHDGGRVEFGPDGKLYWTLGEATVSQRSQDLASLNGKILRLNPDGSIPSDNPFPNSPVYAYGLRNPEGLAWQPGTGRLYATDHGPSGVPSCCHDEINTIEPGQNYGWPVIYGSQTHSGMISPVIESGPEVTWAPSGAAFATRGPWAGSLLFAGLRGQALYQLTLDPNDPLKAQRLEALLQNQYGRLRAVVEGADGAFYLLTSNRDGRGSPVADDDRVLKLTVTQ